MKKLFLLAVAAMALTAVSVSAEEAKVNWEGKCAGCHGKEGKGDTKLGQKLECKDYSDAKVQAAVKDDQMFKSIKDGLKKEEKVLMKPFSDKLSDDEIKALVKYMRGFKK